MTCCVAVKRNNKVVIGTDTLETSGDFKSYATKTVKIKDCYIAIAGLSNTQYIVEGLVRSADWLEAFKMDTIYDARSFATEVWTVLKEEIKLWPAGSKDSDDGNDFLLIATPTKIFKIGRLSGATEIKNYAAIGSGESYAYGVLWKCWKDKRIDLETLVNDAISAAINFDNQCGGKLEIFEV